MKRKISGRQKSEARRRIVIPNLSICYFCKASDLKSNERHCPYCGFPQFGTQPEMKRFIWNVNNKQQLLSEYIDAIDKAKFTLLGISIISLLLSIYYVSNFEKIPAIILLISAGMYIFLWKWCDSKPYITIIIGFIYYIIFITSFFSLTTIKMSSGFYIIAIIGYTLYHGYKSVKKGQAILSELEYIAKTKGLNFKIEDPITFEEDNEFER
ncbi:MAG TPA: hypothetical protein PKZ75_08310 [Bacteroidia bacterium]|nr:hypothetical protein [Bacteroidia bacterium]